MCQEAGPLEIQSFKIYYMIAFIWPFFTLKFIYSEKVTKFCEIFTLLLTVCTVVKSKVKISQNFVAFLEYVKFDSIQYC